MMFSEMLELTGIFSKEIRWFVNKLLWKALFPAASSGTPIFGVPGRFSGILKA